MVLTNTQIIIISTIIFGVLNIIENIIHYSLGRHFGKKGFEFYIPSLNEFLILIVVMLIFAGLEKIGITLFENSN